MTYEELAKRRSEDFKFMVLCHAKGNYGTYDLLRDRKIDEYRSLDISGKSGEIIETKESV